MDGGRFVAVRVSLDLCMTEVKRDGDKNVDRVYFCIYAAMCGCLFVCRFGCFSTCMFV